MQYGAPYTSTPNLVSIVLPTYNSERFLAQAIESVLSQSYTNWELLITDDCSSDNSRHIAQQYVEKDKRIRLFALPQNSGAAVARNNSIKEARGRFLAFIDSDDWWYPDKLESQINFMLRNDIEFCFSAFEYADQSLNVTGVSFKPIKISYSRMKLDCNVGTPGVVIDMRRLGKIFMPEIGLSEDWATWIKVTQKTGYAFSINRPLWKYRSVQGSLSSNKLKLAKSNLNMYRKVLGYSHIKSLMVFLFLFLPSYFHKRIRNIFDSIKYKNQKSLNK